MNEIKKSFLGGIVPNRNMCHGKQIEKTQFSKDPEIQSWQSPKILELRVKNQLLAWLTCDPTFNWYSPVHI